MLFPPSWAPLFLSSPTYIVSTIDISDSQMPYVTSAVITV